MEATNFLSKSSVSAMEKELLLERAKSKWEVKKEYREDGQLF